MEWVNLATSCRNDTLSEEDWLTLPLPWHRAYLSRTSSIWKAKLPGPGPLANKMPLRSLPSIPSNAEIGNVHCVHAGPATKGLDAGRQPRLAAKSMRRYVLP